MIQITTRPGTWDRIAAAFESAQFVRKAERDAVNFAGTRLRKRLPDELAELTGTSKAAARVRGKAAAKQRRGEPEYKLLFSRDYPISKVRARNRKHDKDGSLTIRQPGGKKTKFKSARKHGAGRGTSFTLAKAGPLAERAVGPLRLRRNLFEDDEGYPILIVTRRKAERDLGSAFHASMMGALKELSAKVNAARV